MTERGLPLADGAPACPFVAFDDDRDERSSVPDHRHRCFAESTPAPRALAHQEAYCLSSAFPVCPTFQDWARREAAHSRGGQPAAPAVPSASEREAVPPPVVAPGLAQATAGAGPDDRDHDRMPASRDETNGAEANADGAPPIADGAAAAAAAAALGTAPAAAAPDPEEDDPWDRPAARPDGSAQRNPPRDWAAPPPWLASDEAKRRRADADAEPPSFLGRRAEPGQGLAGSAADRMAGGPSTPVAPAAEEEWTSPARSAGRARPSVPEDVDDEEPEDEPPRRSTRRPRAYAQHLGGPDGPDWERPRRYEAYPTIRSRVGLPRVRVPSIALMAIAVLIAALALFFLPGILHFGGGGSAGPTAKPSATPRPSVSLAPSLAPEPSQQLYTIKKGDTLSKIAAAHGISVDELMAANPTIKDPNKISLGQQIVIPAPGASLPDTVGGSAAPS